MPTRWHIPWVTLVVNWLDPRGSRVATVGAQMCQFTTPSVTLYLGILHSALYFARLFIFSSIRKTTRTKNDPLLSLSFTRGKVRGTGGRALHICRPMFSPPHKEFEKVEYPSFFLPAFFTAVQWVTERCEAGENDSFIHWKKNLAQQNLSRVYKIWKFRSLVGMGSSN